MGERTAAKCEDFERHEWQVIRNKPTCVTGASSSTRLERIPNISGHIVSTDGNSMKTGEPKKSV